MQQFSVVTLNLKSELKLKYGFLKFFSFFCKKIIFQTHFYSPAFSLCHLYLRLLNVLLLRHLTFHKVA